MLLRRVRGLRAQLVLWTILPLGIALIVLSLAGVTRHREAMTGLVADRNRGLALGQANRLAREIDRRTDLLSSTAVRSSSGSIEEMASATADAFPGGLALYSAGGEAQEVSGAAQRWASGDEARVAAARAAVVGAPQHEVRLETESEEMLVLAVPAGGGALVGSIPLTSLGLEESSLQVQAEAEGAVVVFDATGRTVYLYDPTGLDIEPGLLARLSGTLAEGAGSQVLKVQHPLLVSHAPVEPPGWQLAIVADAHAVDAMGLSVVEVLPLTLLAVAILALMALSFGVANVIRPLQELDRQAQRLAWGDFEAVEHPVRGVQEIDDLRATLVQMGERIRSYQSGMRDYLSAVTQAQEAERARLAHELHDDTVQALIALKQRALMARKSLASDPARAEHRLDELTELIDQELTGLRRLIGDLRPIYLEDLGFVPALETLVDQMKQRHGLSAELTVTGETVRLAPDVEMAAFRIAQQALNNVALHANASQVGVSVEFAEDGLTLKVKDNGQGFVPPDQPADLARNGHFGLMGMRERAMLYGGRLDLTSSPAAGTTVTAWLPAC